MNILINVKNFYINGKIFNILVEFETTATYNKEMGFYTNFGIRPMTASVFGAEVKDIETIKFRVSNDQELRNYRDMEYWGWYDNNTKKFNIIAQSHMILNVCFPYGIEVYEKAGHGKAYKLELIK